MSATPRQSRAPGWLKIIFATRSAGVVTDVALLVVRIALAWIFIYYGGSKLFGWFGGPGPKGIHQTALFFAHTAHLRPGTFFAVLGGIVELGGGIAMALGLLARLAGLALVGDMVIAMITVTWSTGLNSITSPPGYQLNIAVGVLALAIALMGAGRYSVDAWLAQRLRLGQGAAPEGVIPGARGDMDQRGHV